MCRGRVRTSTQRFNEKPHCAHLWSTHTFHLFRDLRPRDKRETSALVYTIPPLYNILKSPNITPHVCGGVVELSSITYALGYSFMNNKTTDSVLILREASWYCCSQGGIRTHMNTLKFTYAL